MQIQAFILYSNTIKDTLRRYFPSPHLEVLGVPLKPADGIASTESKLNSRVVLLAKKNLEL
jgi:hypothetical protein